jgi:hypothetical protein
MTADFFDYAEAQAFGATQQLLSYKAIWTMRRRRDEPDDYKIRAYDEKTFPE